MLGVSYHFGRSTIWGVSPTAANGNLTMRKKILSVSQRKRSYARSDSNRLRHLERRIKEWLDGGKASPVPTLRKPLPGALELYQQFGIEPFVDVFVPLPGRSKDSERKARERFRYRRRRRLAGVPVNVQRRPKPLAGGSRSVIKPLGKIILERNERNLEEEKQLLENLKLPQGTPRG